MSIALRNLEENDLGAVQTLIQQSVPALASSPYLQPDQVKATVLSDTNFGLLAEDDGRPVGTGSVLMEQETAETVLGLLSHLCVPQGPEQSSIAASIVQTAIESLKSNLQLCFAEIPATDIWAQAACEQAGFIPCGFLPHKFPSGDTRWNTLVYIHLNEPARNARRPHPAIIAGAQDLAQEVLQAHGIISDIETRDDVVAYPTEASYIAAPIETEAVQTILQTQNPQQSEIFPFLQTTQTALHVRSLPISYLAAKDGDRVIGVLGYILDPIEKRVQIVEGITLDQEPEGFLIASLLEKLMEESSPEYWEVLVSAHSPRMQKTFDQLGFVPCAYLPCFAWEHGMRSDAIKMVKLQAGYESEHGEMTSACKNIYTLIDTTFSEYRVGMAVLKLLRDLRIFRGLGEGELRRVARLFSQKLLRPGEVVFDEGSTGRELYVVERGEIEITTKDGSQLLGTIKNGAVIGEIAFLNGEPRTARAISKSATIVRVVHREDFDKLIQREVHLGLIFFKNVALDLAEKLKQSVVQAKKK
jgi:hypothetical protein